MKKRIAIIISALILFFLFLIISGIYGEYGGANVNRAVGKYIEANNGKSPKSWDDIEPYHLAPVFGFKSVVIVKRYWAVNWDADLMRLYEDTKKTEDLSGYTRTVYNKNNVKDSNEITNWSLHPTIINSIDKLKKVK